MTEPSPILPQQDTLPRRVDVLVVGVGFGGLAALHRLRKDHPQLQTLAIERGDGGTALAFAAFAGAEIYVPRLLVEERHLTPTQAGLALSLAGVACQGGLAGGDAGRRLDGGLCCSDAAAHDGDGDEQSDGRSHDEQPDAGLAALITQPGQGRVAEVHLTTLSTGPVTDRETDGLIHCPV